MIPDFPYLTELPFVTLIQNGRGPGLYTVVLYEIGNRWNAWLFPPPASVWMSKATCFLVPGSL